MHPTWRWRPTFGGPLLESMVVQAEEVPL